MNRQQEQLSSGRATQRQRNMSSPDSIAVIINGWPSAHATSVANSCAKRGFKIVPFGLSSSSSSDKDSMSVHEVPEIAQPIRLVPFTASNAKSEFQKAIQEQRSNGKFVVVVDCNPNGENKDETSTSTNDRVAVYNELQVPFVLESKGGEAHQQVVRDTEQAKSLAIITEQMNKRMSVMDQMFGDWSRRYPGLFDDFDLSFRSSRPRDTPKSLLNSFSDLVHREFGFENVESMPGNAQQQQQTLLPPSSSAEVPQPPPSQQQQKQQQTMPTVEGHLTREYTFKNGGGSSTYTFSQSVNDVHEFAESVADSVGFLAQKSQDMTRPQVYSILDVAAQPSNYLTNW
jgi:hypothetical protein